MSELPLKEFEVHFTRDVHLYVRVVATDENTASELAVTRLKDAGLDDAAVNGVDHDIRIHEDGTSEDSIEEITDPTEYVIITHDPYLVDEDENEDEEDDDDDEEG